MDIVKALDTYWWVSFPKGHRVWIQTVVYERALTTVFSPIPMGSIIQHCQFGLSLLSISCHTLKIFGKKENKSFGYEPFIFDQFSYIPHPNLSPSSYQCPPTEYILSASRGQSFSWWRNLIDFLYFSPVAALWSHWGALEYPPCSATSWAN